MSITARGAKHGAAGLIYIGLILVAIVLVNLIAGRSTARVDLTQDQRFSLDEATKATAGALPGAVEVEIFMSSNMPPQLEQMRRDINDLLASFEAQSGGKLTYEFIDPEASDEFEERATALDIPAWPLEQRSEDEISRRFVYAGVAFVYDDGEEERIETIPQILPGMNYEYELTRSLRAVVREGGPATIGILLGDGGMFDALLDVPFNPQRPTGREEMMAQYEEQIGILFDTLYHFRFVDINDEGPLPDDIDGLFVFGPTAELSDDLRYELDQFVMSGRPVALSISPYRMESLQFDQPGFQNIQVPAMNETGLDALLEEYGVLLRSDAIFDFESGQVSAEQRQVNIGGMRGSTWIPFLDPRLPEISNISDTSVLVPNMNLLAFLPLDRSRPLSQSSLALSASAVAAVDAESLRVDRVLQTSETSYRFEGDAVNRFETIDDADLEPYVAAYEANPESPEIDLERGPFTVAMTVEGRFESAFPDRADAEGHIAETEEARLFVISNGYWVQALLTSQDPLLSRGAMLPGAVRGTVQQYHASNILLLRNTADWLAQDSDLVRIRSRGQAAFFDSGSLEDDEKRFYKLFNIIGLPAIFSFLGILGFLIRQARRSALEQRYGSGA